MREKKEKLIINGNEIYEIDMDCVKSKQDRAGRKTRQSQTPKKQNGKARRNSSPPQSGGDGILKKAGDVRSPRLFDIPYHA